MFTFTFTFYWSSNMKLTVFLVLKKYLDVFCSRGINESLSKNIQ